MSHFKNTAVWLILGLSLSSMTSAADDDEKSPTFLCTGAHFVRAGGTELHAVAIGFRNADLVNPMTIERITVRNVFGAIVLDTGPAAGVAHPLNTDFAVPLDITVVPPGASYYLGTHHIWGNNGLPATAGGNEGGQAISVVVEVSKVGKEDLVRINTRGRSRERIVSLSGSVSQGAERSSHSADCKRID